MRTLIAVLVIALSALGAAQTAGSKTDQELRNVLTDFLSHAGGTDRAVYDRFFADDVIYTRNSGQTVTKAEILKSLEEPRKPDAPKMSYSAEDIKIHDYGDFAVVNFRLLAKSEQDGKTETTNYRDTGTFRRKNGRWQVIAWQATKIAEAPAR